MVPLRPVACGSLLFRSANVLRATVFVKATFALQHDAVAKLVAPLELVDADRLAPPIQRGADPRPASEAEERPAFSLAVASETAPYLPSAGVVLSGVAHAPLGLATPAMVARLAIFAADRPLLDKRVHVYGERSQSAPSPLAMTSMPLVYERALGGPGFDDNPVGVGVGMGGALPNIVDPTDARRPIGFGPIAPTWGPRRRLLAGAERPSAIDGVVEVNDDLDFRYFHAAPSDQQLEFLGGDEWIVLDGMHPEQPRFRSRLPSVRAEARFRMSGGGDGRLRGIELCADTLLIDAERGVASVVWRGNVPIDAAEGAAQLMVFTGVEMPGFPIPWPDEKAAPAFATANQPAFAPAKQPAAAAPLPGMRTPTAPLPVFPGGDEPVRIEKTGRIFPAEIAKPTLPFVEPPRDPPPRPAGPQQPAPQKHPSFAPLPKLVEGEDELFETRALSTDELSLELAQPVAPFALTPPGVRVAAAAPSIPGAPWSKSPAATPPSPAGDVTQGVRVPPPAFLAGAEAARAASQMPSAPSHEANDSPWSGGQARPSSVTRPSSAAPPRSGSSAPPPLEIPKPASLGASLFAEESSTEVTADVAATEIDPGRARIVERLAQPGSLEGLEAARVELSGLDFSGRSLARARLGGAVLSRARFVGATLTGADLTGADLSEADLTEADLSHADLTSATLTGAKLERAKIGEALFARATAGGAVFDGAKGDRPSFAGAKLEAASFRRAELASADFRGATLTRTSFEAASLPEVRLGDASGEGAVFDGARMAKAHGHSAAFAGATFRQADLSGSSWQRAKLPRAVFDGANLRGASLSRAICTDASFADAELSQADLQRLSAERADFREASLDGADLRKAIASGASFVDVAMHRAQVDKANLAGAVLSGADLRGSSLRATILSDANFSFARLEGADLRDADLSNAILRGATREGANFAGATLTGADQGGPEGADRDASRKV